MAKSKPFRAFVEGQTISDGREITADMIDDIVATFNTDTYLPGVNVEHIAGLSPLPPFNRYGDVVAVSAQDDDITVAGKTTKRRALYAVVDGNDQLIKLRKDKQKPFPSVEITPSYSGSGKTGLLGMAFTDNPASIATQPLMFSRAAVTGTLFSIGADAVDLEFEADPAGEKSEAAISTFKAFLASLVPGKKPEEPKPAPVIEQADAGSAFAAQLAEGLGGLQTVFAAQLEQAQAANAALLGRFNALETRLETTDASPQRRAPSSGGTGGIVTDF